MPELDAIRVVLSAYRSTSAEITEEQITAAWAEYDAYRGEVERLRRIIRSERDPDCPGSLAFQVAEVLVERAGSAEPAPYEDRAGWETPE